MNDDGHCAQARLELGVYLLGAIEPAQRALVGRHLAACPQCRAELAGLAAASGLQALYAGAARPPAATAPRWALTAKGADPATGAWAAVRYTPRPWGTEVEVRVTGVAAGTRCQFRVTGPRGHHAAAGGWRIAAGDQAAWYPASVPFQAAGVRGFAVIAGGKILVTVQARDLRD
jgi:anti-sigma factor RsiW